MKKRIKAYLKLNLLSIFFITVSFISVTLAWFAYSGLASVSTTVNVKAWYIELEKDGEKVSHDIVISLDEIYPGMEPIDEKIKIQNLGDSDAEVSYKIVSARILGAAENNYEINGTTVTTEYVEDLLSHEFPFGININLGKNYVSAKSDETFFEVSISWPLDSDDDILDSEWGTKAYNFQMDEKNKNDSDPNYKIRSSIQIVISIVAEQYLELDTSSDIRYDLGDEILFDVVNSKKCETLSTTCIKTYIIDVNNKLGDEVVTLLPNPYNSYLSGTYHEYDTLLSDITNTWTVNTRALFVEDLMKVISTDVKNSFLVRNNLSNSIIGNLKLENRMNKELLKAIRYNGYYEFTNEKFGFISSIDCYWFKSEYNNDNGFTIRRINENISRIYGNSKELSCKVIPVILANKSDL